MSAILVRASAPGKAILSGEYAVLYGAPAIAMAVNRRACVNVEVTENRFNSVACPGLHDRTLEFRTTDDGSLEWLSGAAGQGEGVLLEHIWRAARPKAAENLALTLDTRAFFDAPGGFKLGFGSSAALAVALTSALAGSDLQGDDLFRTAAVAHRNFQNGKGSGVDVAAAVYGGLIGFDINGGSVEQLEWPADLHFLFLWSGKPASTAEKLARLESAGGEDLAPVFAARLADAAAAVSDSWRHGNAPDIMGSLGNYASALQRFSADHGLGVFDAGHAELYEDALERGLVYKPCGAGGGDIGVVFALQRDAAIAFAKRAEARGSRLLDVRSDTRGAVLESMS